MSTEQKTKLKEVERIWLDTKELCDYLRIGSTTLDELRKQGLPFVKLGRLVRFDKRQVDRFMKAREVRNKPVEEVLGELGKKQ